MPSHVRPGRLFSFANWQRSQPRAQLPGDQLDAQIQNLVDAITSTQKALADIRRDDGKLKNESVAAEQLAPDLADEMAGAIERNVNNLVTRAASGIPEFDELLDKAQSKAPTRSLVSIDDVGKATAFLALDGAKLITGDVLYIDGGYHIID